MSAGGRLDSSKNQVADIEVALVNVAIMIAPELLLISRMLDGGRQAVLLCRVDVRASSRFGFVPVVVLDARSTKAMSDGKTASESYTMKNGE